MAVSLDDAEFRYREIKLFEADVYGAPTIAGSIKGMMESAICHTYELMLWEISRLQDFAAENFVKADKEFAQNALEKMVEKEKQQIFEAVPDDEIKEPIDELLKKILEELQKAQENFLTATRGVTTKFLRGITGIQGYAALGLTEKSLAQMLLDLQAGVNQYFGFRDAHSPEASQRASIYLPSAPPAAYMNYNSPIPSAPSQELHAIPVDSSDAIEATDVRVLTQEEMAGMNVRRVLSNTGIAVNDPNALELTLRLRVAQEGQLQANAGFSDDLHRIDQAIVNHPEVSRSMQQHGYVTPTPKFSYSSGKKPDNK